MKIWATENEKQITVKIDGVIKGNFEDGASLVKTSTGAGTRELF